MRRKNKAPTGPTPYEIGLNGTVDEFSAAHKKMHKQNDHKKDIGSFGQEQKELHRGAYNAFVQGRPENIQAMLQDPSAFDINTNYHVEHVRVGDIVHRLTEESGWNPAAVTSALEIFPEQKKEEILDAANNTLYYLASHNDWDPAVLTQILQKFSEQKKQEILDSMLIRALKHYNTQAKNAFVPVLIEAGANANMETRGITLARAIEHDAPFSVIKFLYAQNVSFDDALHIMKANKWGEKNITALKAMHEKITGEPALEETKIEHMQKTIDHLVETCRSLSERVEELESEVAAQRKPSLREAHTKAAATRETAPAKPPTLKIARTPTP